MNLIGIPPRPNPIPKTFILKPHILKSKRHTPSLKRSTLKDNWKMIQAQPRHPSLTNYWKLILPICRKQESVQPSLQSNFSRIWPSKSTPLQWQINETLFRNEIWKLPHSSSEGIRPQSFGREPNHIKITTHTPWDTYQLFKPQSSSYKNLLSRCQLGP